jgi:tetratricopeptide (TPR) repeat protein
MASNHNGREMRSRDLEAMDGALANADRGDGLRRSRWSPSSLGWLAIPALAITYALMGTALLLLWRVAHGESRSMVWLAVALLVAGGLFWVPAFFAFYKLGFFSPIADYCSVIANLVRHSRLHRVGPVRRLVVGVLNLVADQLHTQGRYQKAIRLAMQACDLSRRSAARDDPGYSESLDLLALLYYEMGDYGGAEKLYREAMEIRRTALGDEHPDYASSLHNLAGLLKEQGDYGAAEQLYRKALKIRRIALGDQDSDYASSLNNLAMLLQDMGDYDAAEPLYRQVIEVRRRHLKSKFVRFSLWIKGFRLAMDEESFYASSLNNLATLYLVRGAAVESAASMTDYLAAEPLFREAMEIRRRALGEEHPDYAASLHNLAVLYQAMGKHQAADPLSRKAIEIERRTLGEEHPTYAQSLRVLAGLYLDEGDYAAAEPLCRAALGILHKSLGEDHPQFAGALNDLACLYAGSGRESEALGLMEQATAIGDRMVAQVFSMGSERQRMSYLESIQWQFAVFLSLVSESLSQSQRAVGLAVDLVLRRKAIAAEALAIQRDVVLGGRYPALQPNLRELTALRRRIHQKRLAGPGPEGLRAHQQLLMQWTARGESLDKELGSQISEIGLDQRLRAADRLTIVGALPKDSALIEFVRFDEFDFKSMPGRGDPRWKPARYLAFVLRDGEPNDVGMIDLGRAERLDDLIAGFRASIITEGEPDYHELTESLTDSKPPGIDSGTALRTALWDPLLAAVADRRRLLLAPDGDLTRLPFELLPLGDGRRLLDTYDEMSYLAVGRDILRFGAPSSGQSTEPLVLADPDFDLSREPISHLREVAASSTTRAASGRISRDMDAGFRFQRLPATRTEGERVAALLGVSPRLAAMVLQRELMSRRSPRILHLATHGFFLADQTRHVKELPDVAAEAVAGSRLGTLMGFGRENPLLRSGLALAGANTWLGGGSPPDDAETGILTAEDVSGLDLVATELVVLSACDTGLGEVRSGEGVFGLRRAFVVAGARTLVMSLWRVSDLATAILMERFYENLVQRSMGRAQALRAAQTYIRDLTLGQIREHWLTDEILDRLAAGDVDTRQLYEFLAENPDDYRPFEHPQFWGAFICQGDPGPLQNTA